MESRVNNVYVSLPNTFSNHSPLIATSCPYPPGRNLSVQFDGQPYESLNVTIIKVFEPFTLSCALLVRLDWPMLQGEYVLKLFDHRYATQLRRDNQASAWTADIEVAYHALVESTDMTSLFTLYAQKETDDEWTPKAETD